MNSDTRSAVIVQRLASDSMDLYISSKLMRQMNGLIYTIRKALRPEFVNMGSRTTMSILQKALRHIASITRNSELMHLVPANISIA